MSIKIEVLSSPGCSKCKQARERLRRLSDEEFPGRIEWREVNILEELDYAVRIGVLSTPAIAVDGKLEFRGLPGVKKLREFIQSKLEAR